MPITVEQTTPESTPNMIITSYATSDCTPKGTISAVAKKDGITTPYGHLPLQSSRRQYCKFARFQNVLKPCVSKRLFYVCLPSPTHPPAIKLPCSKELHHRLRRGLSAHACADIAERHCKCTEKIYN